MIIIPVLTLPQARSQTNNLEYQPFYDLIYSGKYPPDANTKLSDYEKNTFIKTLQNGRSTNQIENGDIKESTLINPSESQENDIPEISVPNDPQPDVNQQFTNVQPKKPVNLHEHQYSPYKMNTPTAISSPVGGGGWFSSYMPARISIMNYGFGTQSIFDFFNLAKIAMYDFFDVPMIRSMVDLYFDGFTPRGRTAIDDIPQERENEGIRRFLTTAAGGLLDKEKCWERLNCKIGELLTDIQGKNIALKLIQTVVPPRWTSFRSSLELVEKGSNNNEYCTEFECRDSRLHVEAEL